MDLNLPVSDHSYHMMISLRKNAYNITGSLWEESIGHQGRGKQSFDVFFDARLNTDLQTVELPAICDVITVMSYPSLDS